MVRGSLVVFILLRILRCCFEGDGGVGDKDKSSSSRPLLLQSCSDDVDDERHPALGLVDFVGCAGDDTEERADDEEEVDADE